MLFTTITKTKNGYVMSFSHKFHACEMISSILSREGTYGTGCVIENEIILNKYFRNLSEFYNLYYVVFY
jgi:hypothetical protein